MEERPRELATLAYRRARLKPALQTAAAINRIAGQKALATLSQLQACGYVPHPGDQHDLASAYLTAMERAALMATAAVLRGLRR